jgi:hypothetical protein
LVLIGGQGHSGAPFLIMLDVFMLPAHLVFCLLRSLFVHLSLQYEAAFQVKTKADLICL